MSRTEDGYALCHVEFAGSLDDVNAVRTADTSEGEELSLYGREDLDENVKVETSLQGVPFALVPARGDEVVLHLGREGPSEVVLYGTVTRVRHQITKFHRKLLSSRRDGAAGRTASTWVRIDDISVKR